VRLASGRIDVLIVNRIVASPDDTGGAGQSITIDLQLAGIPPGGELSLRTLDANTPLDSGPVSRKVDGGANMALTLGGYSVTIVSYEPTFAMGASSAAAR